MENSMVIGKHVLQDIHDLPPELMAKIFLTSIPDPARPSLIQPPLNVSHTCRLWRDISLSSPELWAHLCLDLPRVATSGYNLRIATLERWYHILKAWTQRSGKAPLNFVIETSEIFKPWLYWDGDWGYECFDGPARYQVALRLFFKTVSLWMKERARWETVAIHFYEEEESKVPSFDIRFSNMVALRSLTAFVKGCEIDLTLSSRVQYLRLLCFKSIELGETQFRFLTRLELDLRFYHDPSKCLDMCTRILQQAPNLLALDLSSSPIGHNHQISSLGDYITLSHLKELRLYKISSLHAELLRWLTLPALTRMEIDSHPEPLENGCQIVLDFLRRSLPPLEWLESHRCLVGIQHFRDALRLLPTLQFLSLKGLFFPEVLRELAVDGSDGLCPQLRELHLINRSREDADHSELLIDILLSRLRRIGTFKATLRDWGKQYKRLKFDSRVQGCIVDGLVLKGL